MMISKALPDLIEGRRRAGLGFHPPCFFRMLFSPTPRWLPRNCRRCEFEPTRTFGSLNVAETGRTTVASSEGRHARHFLPRTTCASSESSHILTRCSSLPEGRRPFSFVRVPPSKARCRLAEHLSPATRKGEKSHLCAGDFSRMSLREALPVICKNNDARDNNADQDGDRNVSKEVMRK